MFIRICALALALALVLPDYCFAAKPLDLPMPLSQELQVEVIQSLQEVAVAVPGTASAMGMQNGLLGMMIGDAVQNAQVKKSEARVAPLRDLLVDYRFHQKMEQTLRKQLPSAGLSLHPVVTVLPSMWEAQAAEEAGKRPPYALVLTPAYAFDHKFNQMTGSLSAEVLERTVKPNGKPKVIPRFTRNYVYQYPMEGVRSADPVQDWAALGNDTLARLLDRGIDQAAQMLVYDFSAEGRAAWNIKAKHLPIDVAGSKYNGVLIRRGDDWAWLRIGNAYMQMVLGIQPLQAGVAPVMEAKSEAAAAPASTSKEVVTTPAQAPPATVPTGG